MATETGPTLAIEQRDDEVVATYGYKHELRRSLRFFSLFAVAFSIVSISTGIFLNYGFGLAAFGPAMIWTWPIAGVGQIVIALIIAELSTKIPLAGYAYQWGARLVNSTYGWFTGFSALLYMTITGGAIILTGCAPLLLNSFGQASPSGRLVLAVALILFVVTVVINIISVQFAARVNNIAIFTEILGTVVFAALVLILWGVHGQPGGHNFGILGNTSGSIVGSGIYRFGIAGLIGIYTLVGFELSADLTEEAVDSQRAVPRGILTGVGSAVVLGMFALICFTLAIPNLKTTAAAPFPLVAIASHYMSSVPVHILTLLVAFSMFALVVMNQAAQARLLYSMGRDNMLPFSNVFREVHQRTRTPLYSLCIGGVASIGLMIYGYNQSNTFATLIGATSIAPYIVYLLIVISYMNKRKQLAAVHGGFNLGRWGTPLMVVGLFWIVAALVILVFPQIFHGADRVVGGGLIIALLWWIFVLRARIAGGKAGVAKFETTAATVESELAAPPSV
jgi:amino acid transporter